MEYSELAASNCARWEELAQKKTYKGPWERATLTDPGQALRLSQLGVGLECLVDLPPSRGQPWHLAGIWNTWTDKTTGEVFESYSMLTQNCDAHSLLNMPELDLPSDKQDKRTVVPMEVGDFRTWPTGSNEEAASLVRLPPALV